MAAAEHGDLFYKFGCFLFGDEVGRLDSVDQYLELRDGEIVIGKVIELFVILLETAHLVAAGIQRGYIAAEGADMAGDAGLMHALAELDTGYRVLFVGLRAEYLIELQQLDLRAVLAHGRLPPYGYNKSLKSIAQLPLICNFRRGQKCNLEGVIRISVAFGCHLPTSLWKDTRYEAN